MKCCNKGRTVVLPHRKPLVLHVRYDYEHIKYVLVFAGSCGERVFVSSMPTHKEKDFWYVEKSSFVVFLLLLSLPVMILFSFIICRHVPALMVIPLSLSLFAFVCVLLGLSFALYLFRFQENGSTLHVNSL